MRIAFVALHFAEYSAHLAAALAADNDVLLLLYGDNARNELGGRLHLEFDVFRLQISLIERPVNAFDVLRNAQKLISGIHSFQPDVIHFQEDLRDELVLAIPFLPQCPRFMTIHDPVNHSGTDARRLRFSRHRIYRALVRPRMDHFFVHGKALIEELLQQLPQFAGAVHTVPHGPLGPSQSINVPSPVAPASFLFFGRLHEYKGLCYFIESIQRLHRAGLPVRGVIAGRGADLAPNRGLIEQTPAAFEVIERYITEEEVHRLFSETTAPILPYIDGTQSGVAAMALGYGRPVVASRVGSIPELVRDGVNGLLVSPRDVEGLARAMKVLATDASRWQSLARGAIDLRDGELSWRQIAKTTVNAYCAALS